MSPLLIADVFSWPAQTSIIAFEISKTQPRHNDVKTFRVVIEWRCIYGRPKGRPDYCILPVENRTYRVVEGVPSEKTIG